MDKPRLNSDLGSATANHTAGGSLPRHPAAAPADDDDLDEIKSAVLAKLRWTWARMRLSPPSETGSSQPR